MELNSTEILERGLITGPLSVNNIAQVGIDLNVVEVKNIASGGFIPEIGKTVLPRTTPIEIFEDLEHKCKVWFLSPGIYEIVMEQGCKIPPDCSMTLYPRSSLARIGGCIVAPKWDPGFETEKMTSFMILHKTVKIAVGARLVQAVFTKCTPVSKDKLYNGQFQGK
jgi:deoxycytidine triphosphate deaminase